MYLIAIAWLYVALMMSVAEATHPLGTVLGAILTFLLYGAAPVALVMYLLGGRFRRQPADTATAGNSDPILQPDGSSHAPADLVAPERKEV